MKRRRKLYTYKSINKLFTNWKYDFKL
jgi:hypothetical protein